MASVANKLTRLVAFAVLGMSVLVFSVVVTTGVADAAQKSMTFTKTCGDRVFTLTVTGSGFVSVKSDAGGEIVNSGGDRGEIKCDANTGSGECSTYNNGNAKDGSATCTVTIKVSDVTHQIEYSDPVINLGGTAYETTYVDSQTQTLNGSVQEAQPINTSFQSR